MEEIKKRKKGLLIVVSGPSGVGKSTILRRFLREDNNSQFSVSYTTRKKREGEVNGKDYYFIDEKSFREMVNKGCFLEWEMVHGHMYGTPKKEILDFIEHGIDIFLDIDVKGAIKVKSVFPDAVMIFIEPPSKEELIRRLSLRKEKEIDIRMKRVEEEIDKKEDFQYNIVNNDLEEAYNIFKQIIETVRERSYGKDNS